MNFKKNLAVLLSAFFVAGPMVFAQSTKNNSVQTLVPYAYPMGVKLNHIFAFLDDSEGLVSNIHGYVHLGMETKQFQSIHYYIRSYLEHIAATLQGVSYVGRYAEYVAPDQTAISTLVIPGSQILKLGPVNTDASVAEQKQHIASRVGFYNMADQPDYFTGAYSEADMKFLKTKKIKVTPDKVDFRNEIESKRSAFSKGYYLSNPECKELFKFEIEQGETFYSAASKFGKRLCGTIEIGTGRDFNADQANQNLYYKGVFTFIDKITKNLIETLEPNVISAQQNLVRRPVPFANEKQLISIYPIFKLDDAFRLDLGRSESEKYRYVDVTDKISENVKTPGFSYFVVERK